MKLELFLTPGVGPWVRFLHFTRFVRAYVRPIPSPAILDAGFGRGEHLAWLAEQIPAARLRGYDTSAGDSYAGNIDTARDRLRGRRAELRLGDLREIQDDGEFDVAYTIDVLEHIPGNERVLTNLFRALRPGGLLYLAMPYDRGARTLLPARGLRRFRKWAEEEHAGEMRSLRETAALLERLGFTILETHHTFGVPARLAWEIEQVVVGLPGGEWLAVAIGPILKGLASLELILPRPGSGNLLIVARR